MTHDTDDEEDFIEYIEETFDVKHQKVGDRIEWLHNGVKVYGDIPVTRSLISINREEYSLDIIECPRIIESNSGELEWHKGHELQISETKCDCGNVHADFILPIGNEEISQFALDVASMVSLSGLPAPIGRVR